MKNQPSITDNDLSQMKTPAPSFVKLAMRNMVKKGNQSLTHFFITAFGFLGFILLLAWFARPHLPS